MGEAKTYGATPVEWAHFQRIGLTEHLLPVVSTPGIRIAVRSKMTSIGKTPSTLDGNGEVVGLLKWTARTSTAAEVSRWAADGRLGICIQCREVRALDLDIDDEMLVLEIQAAVRAALGVMPPVRSRSNSPKVLLGIRVAGFLAKRTFKTPHGVVEFLGNGQQFIAAGAHWSSKPNEPSGARYSWDGGLPASFPEITRDAFEVLWADLHARFGIEGSATGGPERERKRAEAFDAFDAVGEYLVGEGLVIDQGHDGAMFVECPWAAEHTSDTGPSATAWFPAGTGGYDRGHFKCLHAHCHGRTDFDFTDAIGFDLAQFDVIPEEIEQAVPGEIIKPVPQLLPAFKRNSVGEIEATLPNILAALVRPDFAGVQIGFDEAIGAIVMRADEAEPWRAVTDLDMVQLRIILERKHFKPIGREPARDALLAASSLHTFDSIRDWVTGLRWDRVPRVESFLARYFGAEDTPYTRAVSRYWWTAQAGRAIEPGVQADMVPILKGEQGIGKTQALKALLPSLDNYVEINLQDDDDKLARVMRGALLGEIAELRGLRSRDAESIKAWITRQIEKWVPKFMEHATAYRRRLLLVATTNADDFLDDETGERRWLPVETGIIGSGEIDLAGLAADRDQLWAEGALLFACDGVDWRDAQRLAPAEHGKFKVRDEWTAAVVGWSRAEIRGGEEGVTTQGAAVGALGFDLKQVGRREEMRIAKIFKHEGWKKSRVGERNDRRVLWCHTYPDFGAGGVG